MEIYSQSVTATNGDTQSFAMPDGIVPYIDIPIVAPVLKGWYPYENTVYIGISASVAKQITLRWSVTGDSVQVFVHRKFPRAYFDITE